MNDSTRIGRRLPRARPPTARTAAAIIATASLALAAASYGSPRSATSVHGSPNGRESASTESSHKKASPSSGNKTPRQAAQDYAQLLGWAKCMRDRGYPRMPDPKHGTPQPMGGRDVVVLGWGPAAYLVVPAAYDVYSQKFQKACPEIDPVTGNPRQ